MQHENAVRRLATYFLQSDEYIHAPMVTVDTNLSPLQLNSRAFPDVTKTIANLKEEWRNKVLHGRFYAALLSDNVDSNLSTLYLKNGDLMPEKL